MSDRYSDYGDYGSPVRASKAVNGAATPSDVKIEPSGIRPSHSDRDRITRHLGDCLADGRISETEMGARVKHVEGAESQPLLNLLISDLPPLPPTKEQAEKQAAKDRRKMPDRMTRLNEWSRKDPMHRIATPVITFAALFPLLIVANMLPVKSSWATTCVIGAVVLTVLGVVASVISVVHDLD